MSSDVNMEAKVVNGIGSVLAIVAWLGFAALLVFEIIMTMVWRDIRRDGLVVFGSTLDELAAGVRV